MELPADQGVPQKPRGDPRDEYLDVSSNIRHYQTIRFAQPTLLITVSVALITVLYVSKVEVRGNVRTALEAVGLGIALLLGVVQERTMVYWNHFMGRAVELEAELGFKQYSTRPEAGLLSSTNAMRGFFLGFAVFWLISLIWID